MIFKSILIANRGEIAIRIARAASDLGARAVVVFAPDDAASLHVKSGDAAVALTGAGARAYLNIEAVIDAARNANCDAVHPGYGFLSESAVLARACAAAGLTFIGPSPKRSTRLATRRGRARSRSAPGCQSSQDRRDRSPPTRPASSSMGYPRARR